MSKHDVKDSSFSTQSIESARWSQAEINNLPDSSFAVIETGGEKDSDGKTTPRSLRHLPYKDASGKVDLPHLRNALARLPQTSISSDLKNKARVKLEKAAKDAGIGDAAASLVAAFCDEYSSELLQKVTDLQAVGRMISQKNLKTLCDAHQILGDLIQAAQKMESARIVFDGDMIRFETTFEAGERLGSMLQRRRRELGLTLDDVAMAAGISEQSYQGIEAGYNSQPPDDIMTLICQKLGLDVNECQRAASIDRDMPVNGGYPSRY